MTKNRDLNVLTIQGELCPRCGSPDPKRHPAVQHEGEVQPCPHPFHGPDSLGKNVSNVSASGEDAETSVPDTCPADEPQDDNPYLDEPCGPGPGTEPEPILCFDGSGTKIGITGKWPEPTPIEPGEAYRRAVEAMGDPDDRAAYERMQHPKDAEGHQSTSGTDPVHDAYEATLAEAYEEALEESESRNGEHTKKTYNERQQALVLHCGCAESKMLAAKLDSYAEEIDQGSKHLREAKDEIAMLRKSNQDMAEQFLALTRDWEARGEEIGQLRARVGDAYRIATSLVSSGDAFQMKATVLSILKGPKGSWQPT